jgi:hypothetical protein
MPINAQEAALLCMASRIEFEGGASCNQPSFLKAANRDLVLGNAQSRFYAHLTRKRG